MQQDCRNNPCYAGRPRLPHLTTMSAGNTVAELQDQSLPCGPVLAWKPLRMQLLANIKLNYPDLFSSTIC
jgi:hypothetical protein